MMAAAWRRVAGGDFNVRLDFTARDERAELIRAFNETIPKLADHLRLRESLELAQEVQRNLLPRTPPSLPGLDVAGINLSCDETGGDYFDYFPLAREEGTVLAACDRRRDRARGALGLAHGHGPGAFAGLPSGMRRAGRGPGSGGPDHRGQPASGRVTWATPDGS
jgi:sigma-B regulation protein RsbU (phosphoserine phosphatase)